MGTTRSTRAQREGIKQQIPGQQDMIVHAPLGQYSMSIADGSFSSVGSGKMLAYIIPLVSRLEKRKGTTLQTTSTAAQPWALMLAPTHELAIEIMGQLVDVCKYTSLRPCVVYRGAPVTGQKEQLKLGCDILVGPLGRLGQFAHQPSTLLLHLVRTLVIDEADEMSFHGWD